MHAKYKITNEEPSEFTVWTRHRNGGWIEQALYDSFQDAITKVMMLATNEIDCWYFNERGEMIEPSDTEKTEQQSESQTNELVAAFLERTRRVMFSDHVDNDQKHNAEKAVKPNDGPVDIDELVNAVDAMRQGQQYAQQQRAKQTVTYMYGKW